MVTVTISVRLNEREPYGLTGVYDGSQDPGWQNEMALACQRAMQAALARVEIPSINFSGMGNPQQRDGE